MKTRNKYYFHKKELSRLLKDHESVSFYQDEFVIDRIINLLTESKSIEKIKGIISATEILKFGGDIEEEEVNEIFDEIIEWWSEKT